MSVKLHRNLSRMPGLDSEQQPWRCAKCNVSVRKGMNDPCDCTRAIAAASVDKRKQDDRHGEPRCPYCDDNHCGGWCA